MMIIRGGNISKFLFFSNFFATLILIMEIIKKKISFVWERNFCSEKKIEIFYDIIGWIFGLKKNFKKNIKSKYLRYCFLVTYINIRKYIASLNFIIFSSVINF